MARVLHTILAARGWAQCWRCRRPSNAPPLAKFECEVRGRQEVWIGLHVGEKSGGIPDPPLPAGSQALEASAALSLT